MPFQSRAQERWMFANHPQMAKKWAALTDQSSLPERKPSLGHKAVIPKVDQVDTRQSYKPGQAKVKGHTAADDFKHLTPNAKARMKIAKPAKEQDAMEESGVTFVPGSRGHHLNKRKGS